MKQWEKIIRHVVNDGEDHFDRLKNRLESRFDQDKSILIQPYIGHGNGKKIHLKGRVMKNKGTMQANERDSLWHNLLNTYKRFATDEVPFAVVKAQLGDYETTVTADDEGFFVIEMPFSDDYPSSEIIYPIPLELVKVSEGFRLQEPVHATGHVIVAGSNAEYGIISDLDDTVIQSDVVNLIKLAKNTFMQNAQTRLPFSGVSAFYRALKNGYQTVQNPIYYVSSSPWNLYDLLTDFLELKNIPSGPLFLQDFGLNSEQWLTQDHDIHKHNAIKEILATHPQLTFVLIGDSTQHDPEIYYKVAVSNPDRIKVIYIRDVNSSSKRHEEIKLLSDQLFDEHGIIMHLVKDTLQAAINAVELKLIHPDALDVIRQISQKDDQEPNAIEQLIENSIHTE